MRRLLPVVLSGCVYVVHPAGPDHAPRVLDAEAYVYYDDYYRDDIWDLQALVGDPDGAGDVRTVWADVYDEGAGGTYVGSVSLAEHGPDDPRRMETLLDLGGEQRFGSEADALVFVEQAARDYVDRLLGGH